MVAGEHGEGPGSVMEPGAFSIHRFGCVGRGLSPFFFWGVCLCGRTGLVGLEGTGVGGFLRLSLSGIAILQLATHGLNPALISTSGFTRLNLRAWWAHL